MKLNLAKENFLQIISMPIFCELLNVIELVFNNILNLYILQL